MGFKGWEPIYNLENAAKLTAPGQHGLCTSSGGQGPRVPKLALGGGGAVPLAVGLIGKAGTCTGCFSVLDPSFGFIMLMMEI